MLNLYYTFNPTKSHGFLFRILKEYHGISEQPLLYNAHGKPYLTDTPVFFSITHSGNLTAVAVCDQPVGLDAEYTQRTGNRAAILNRLSDAERTEISDAPAFFLHWTAKESYVKFRGETLAKLYGRLRFVNGILSLDGNPCGACLQSGFFCGEKYVFTLCTQTAEPINRIEMKL